LTVSLWFRAQKKVFVMVNVGNASNSAPEKMTGFDPEFRDLDHYIRVITERIWEGRRIDDIHRYYSDPCVVETPSSVTTSVADVVAGTKATLAQFPDRRLLAEDIIQSGDAEHGFLSSHRIISTMTHLGDGNFGKATGRKIHVRTIADCVCKDNRIIHEWLVRDQAAIAIHIGITPRELAQRWLDERGGWNKPVAGVAPAGYESHISNDAIAQSYASAIRDFANGKASPSKTYDDAVHHLGPDGKTRYGQDEVAAYWRELFAAFSVQSFYIEHLAMQRGGGRVDRVAFRWRANALHSGEGQYGNPTAKPIEIMGINHAEFFNGRVLREWVLVDDIALWMQVLTTD
jgi:predicted ester cyclase